MSRVLRPQELTKRDLADQEEEGADSGQAHPLLVSTSVGC
ncbi:hypothetical protein ACVK1Q_003137 [Methylobacterium sp. PvP108]|uniref:Uncharacterized protein n=1 Tax=Methylobacterium radiotolerans TaxID=31998 RepID=A0ABV2NGL5_9HYPH|nr:hypothetical protein [Methylobacterium sp. PvP105]MBP2502495.1 hypothetical protein [Methylobacterium sp. PvP109]